ncbi:unnamed protein product [Amoebophrya sp. A120]|nr:unnamed protein product [Amoebophrya sp. A120]|eukprot:GSA120T00015128001.1
MPGSCRAKCLSFNNFETVYNMLFARSCVPVLFFSKERRYFFLMEDSRCRVLPSPVVFLWCLALCIASCASEVIAIAAAPPASTSTTPLQRSEILSQSDLHRNDEQEPSAIREYEFDYDDILRLLAIEKFRTTESFRYALASGDASVRFRAESIPMVTGSQRAYILKQFRKKFSALSGDRVLPSEQAEIDLQDVIALENAGRENATGVEVLTAPCLRRRDQPPQDLLGSLRYYALLAFAERFIAGFPSRGNQRRGEKTDSITCTIDFLRRGLFPGVKFLRRVVSSFRYEKDPNARKNLFAGAKQLVAVWKACLALEAAVGKGNERTDSGCESSLSTTPTKRSSPLPVDVEVSTAHGDPVVEEQTYQSLEEAQSEIAAVQEQIEEQEADETRNGQHGAAKRVPFHLGDETEDAAMDDPEHSIKILATSLVDYEWLHGLHAAALPSVRHEQSGAPSTATTSNKYYADEEQHSSSFSSSSWAHDLQKSCKRKVQVVPFLIDIAAVQIETVAAAVERSAADLVLFLSPFLSEAPPAGVACSLIDDYLDEFQSRQINEHRARGHDLQVEPDKTLEQEEVARGDSIDVDPSGSEKTKQAGDEAPPVRTKLRSDKNVPAVVAGLCRMQTRRSTASGRPGVTGMEWPTREVTWQDWRLEFGPSGSHFPPKKLILSHQWLESSTTSATRLMPAELFQQFLQDAFAGAGAGQHAPRGDTNKSENVSAPEREKVPGSPDRERGQSEKTEDEQSKMIRRVCEETFENSLPFDDVRGKYPNGIYFGSPGMIQKICAGAPQYFHLARKQLKKNDEGFFSSLGEELPWRGHPKSSTTITSSSTAKKDDRALVLAEFILEMDLFFLGIKGLDLQFVSAMSLHVRPGPSSPNAGARSPRRSFVEDVDLLRYGDDANHNTSAGAASLLASASSSSDSVVLYTYYNAWPPTRALGLLEQQDRVLPFLENRMSFQPDFRASGICLRETESYLGLLAHRGVSARFAVKYGVDNFSVDHDGAAAAGHQHQSAGAASVFFSRTSGQSKTHHSSRYQGPRPLSHRLAKQEEQASPSPAQQEVDTVAESRATRSSGIVLGRFARGMGRCLMLFYRRRSRQHRSRITTSAASGKLNMEHGQHIQEEEQSILGLLVAFFECLAYEHTVRIPPFEFDATGQQLLDPDATAQLLSCENRPVASETLSEIAGPSASKPKGSGVVDSELIMLNPLCYLTVPDTRAGGGAEYHQAQVDSFRQVMEKLVLPKPSGVTRHPDAPDEVIWWHPKAFHARRLARMNNETERSAPYHFTRFGSASVSYSSAADEAAASWEDGLAMPVPPSVFVVGPQLLTGSSEPLVDLRLERKSQRQIKLQVQEEQAAQERRGKTNDEPLFEETPRRGKLELLEAAEELVWYDGQTHMNAHAYVQFSLQLYARFFRMTGAGGSGLRESEWSFLKYAGLVGLPSVQSELVEAYQFVSNWWRSLSHEVPGVVRVENIVVPYKMTNLDLLRQRDQPQPWEDDIDVMLTSVLHWEEMEVNQHGAAVPVPPQVLERRKSQYRGWHSVAECLMTPDGDRHPLLNHDGEEVAAPAQPGGDLPAVEEQDEHLVPSPCERNSTFHRGQRLAQTMQFFLRYFRHWFRYGYIGTLGNGYIHLRKMSAIAIPVDIQVRLYEPPGRYVPAGLLYGAPVHIHPERFLDLTAWYIPGIPLMTWKSFPQCKVPKFRAHPACVKELQPRSKDMHM